MTVKKNFLGTIMLLLFVVAASASNDLPFGPDGTDQSEKLVPWLAPAVGFTPSVDAFRISAMSGNLVLNRLGAYVTIESGMGSDYFTNIWGGTLAVTRHSYVYGGLDLFTSRGVINGFKGSRKEIGLGLMPWKGLVLNIGWSGSVGTSFSAGYTIPVFRNQ